jgi:rhodanese-related sulfurtransferase
MLNRLTRRGLVALAGTAGLLVSQDSQTTRVLTPEEASKALEGADVFLLDVREPKELEESGTIKGYVNIPLGQLESRLKEIPKDKVIVTL